jgi:hypothetical protein
MKQFILYLIYMASALVLILYGLEFLYEYNMHHGTARTKPALLMSSWSDDKKFDYAIVGSSRAAMHLNAVTIEKETGKKGFNFGVNGSELFENKLTIKVLIKKEITQKVFLQIDNNFDTEIPDKANSANWLPFTNKKYIGDEFQKLENKDEYTLYEKIPFYKYLSHDGHIGFRENFMSLMGRENPSFKNLGLLNDKKSILKDSISEFKYVVNKKNNKQLNEIIDLCKKNNVELILFTSPFYRPDKKIELFEENFENYYDFSDALNDYKLYYNPTHLNSTGAEKFTKLFIEEFFTSK